MSGRKDKPRDPFLLGYQPSELRIASEFLNTWLPFLSRDLCPNCSEILTSRIRSLDQELVGKAESAHTEEKSTLNNLGLHDNHDDNCDTNSFGSCQDVTENNSFGGSKDEENEGSENIQEEEAFGREITPESHSMKTPESRVSWADMVQEDELEGEEEESGESKRLVNLNASTGKLTISRVVQKPKLPREQREYIRFMNVNRNKDFMCFERINGKLVNILAGLELHTGIFSAAEQTRIVNQVYLCQEMGKKGELKERTYTAPRKWMRGKGRVTIQFGCCYNYATDKNGNPPGILQNECVDPIPHLFKVIIRRLVQWHVLPPTCIPDSCIVNIYDEGDCIPPHIDNHDFVRPFCTVSFLSECNIVFGTNLEVKGPGEFTGPIAIPLPMGSVLVLNGNGADVAKHCVPAVPQKRISITFRRMDESKRPTDFIPEPDLLNIQPLSYDVDKINRPLSHGSEPEMRRDRQWRGSNINARRFTEYATTQSEPRNSTWTWHGPVDRRRVRLNLDG